MSDELKSPETLIPVEATRLQPDESRLFGVSMRAWIMLLVVGTICAREIALFVHCLQTNSYVEQVKEPMYGLVIAVVSFYFGQQMKK